MLNWRRLIRAKTYAELKTWHAVPANAALAAAVHEVRPQSFSDVPLVYVGGIRVESEAASGVMRNTGEVEVFAVTGSIDNVEASYRVDDLIDSLVAWFAARPHYVDANTVAEPTGSEPVDLSVGDAAYTASMLTIGRILWAEGRN